MKKIFVLVALLFTALALAAVPASIVDVTYTLSATGPVPDSVNLYIDDCAVTGPVGAPFATLVASGPQSGAPYDNAVTVEGIYQVCARVVNAVGITPDPGPVHVFDTAEFDLSSPINTLSITVEFACGTGVCTKTYQ